jgi:prolyl 4-hydroxylase
MCALKHSLFLATLVICLRIASGDEQELSATPGAPPIYGVDVSFPAQNAHVADFPRPFGNDRIEFYNKFLQGCREYYKDRSKLCDESELSRLNLNRQQPPVMQNYTSAGYAKVQLPSQITKRLVDFWERNQGAEETEQWPPGNTYVNHWDSPTYMLSLSNEKLKGGGKVLQRSVLESVQSTLEAWTGQSLVFTSLYGIRVYKEGAVLSPHIDRLPLVTSCIVNVAQDVDEPWALEVIGHDGKASNVTLEPGEMILYESQSVLHGRPFPLKGRYYANVFLHFEPHGHTERFNDKETRDPSLAAKERYVHALAKPSPPSQKYDIPDYIQAGSAQEKKWKQEYIFQAVEPKKTPKQAVAKAKPFIKSTAHSAASGGDLATIKKLQKTDKQALLAPDRNGWKPIHEAARSGETEIVDILIKEGADVNERTNNGTGGTPLWWAQQLFDEAHPVVQLLLRNGAVNVAPDPD